jgi:hypothetical protein
VMMRNLKVVSAHKFLLEGKGFLLNAGTYSTQLLRQNQTLCFITKIKTVSFIANDLSKGSRSKTPADTKNKVETMWLL